MKRKSRRILLLNSEEKDLLSIRGVGKDNTMPFAMFSNLEWIYIWVSLKCFIFIFFSLLKPVVHCFSFLQCIAENELLRDIFELGTPLSSLDPSSNKLTKFERVCTSINIINIVLLHLFYFMFRTWVTSPPVRQELSQEES